MVHYEKNRKLKVYKGNLSEFVKLVPEAAAYYKLESDSIAFSFPEPGMLEGVTSRTKALIKMSDVSFKYPSREVNTLNNISVQVSMASRVAVIGVNGAGKSTMIKLMVGEIEPNKSSTGEVWKHPNARVAYVAQHAFHHIENHLEKTPNEYVRWRYEHGSDKEGLEKVTSKLTEEEELALAKPVLIDVADDKGVTKTMKAAFERFTEGRRKTPKSKDQEHEIEWLSGFTSWVTSVKLTALGFGKLLKQVDEKIAAKATQLVRPLTNKFVENHLNDVGLEPEFASYSRIGALSGGQKVKVVLAAAMWNTPHIIILDEPTNYLDRDSLGAMAEAINLYEGGVVIISHNAQFVDQVCPEVWHLENHTLNLKGSYNWLESANKEAAKVAKAADTYIDGQGNEVEIAKARKKASKSELKKIKKDIAAKRKGGQECYTDEELELAGFLPDV